MSQRPSKPALKPDNIGQYPIRPLAALRAFRLLVQDKEDTVQVFRIVRALAGRALSNGFLKLLKTPEGGRQARRQSGCDLLLVIGISTYVELSAAAPGLISSYR